MASPRAPLSAPVSGRPMKGSIAQLWHGRLCGMIRARDGQDVFFHARDLQDVRYNDLEVRGTVVFELIADAVSGPRAVRVRVAKRSPS